MKNDKGVLAIFKTGGKQYKVRKEDILDVEKIAGKPGTRIKFNEVLLVSDGKKTEVGTPYLSNVKIEAEIIEQIKGEKITIFKYKPKKRYRRKRGHRQNYTKIRIVGIKTA